MKKKWTWSRILMVTAIIALEALQSKNCAAEVATFLELPAPGGVRSWADKVSADGSTIVGRGEITSGHRHATSWTAFGAVTDLGTLGGDTSGASGVSADGSVICGFSVNRTGSHEAFVWTEATGMVGLGDFGVRSFAFSVSANGRVIVGYSEHSPGVTEAFAWTAEAGMIGLGDLGGGNSLAWGVSADGSVIVGESQKVARGSNEAFVWTAEAGMVGLGTLGGRHSTALGVSADGSVIVGASEPSTGPSRAFVWTAEAGMIPLDSLPNAQYGAATTLTDDGSTAAGNSYGIAAVWNTTTGEVRELQTLLLQDYGLDTKKSKLGRCYISGDGSTLVGIAINSNGNHDGAWVVTISEDADVLLEHLIVDVADINLANGISNALDSKLDAAIDALLADNAEQRQNVVNNMLSFINHTEAQRGKKISEADADHLIDAAKRIIQLVLQGT